MPFYIPDSWEWVTLKSIAISSLGKTLDKANNKGELKPYLCSTNVYWDGIDLTTVKEARLKEGELPKYLLKPGDLLICEGGDVGRSAVWEYQEDHCLCPGKSSGKRKQKVKIFFNFVDDVDIPVISEPIITQTTYERRKTA